jgi:RNA polymerase sigma-70 factor (ECF subfamily)
VSSSDRFFLTAGMWVAAKSEDESSTTPLLSDDEALIARVQAGDETALGVLFDRYSRLVVSIGSRILRDPGEAQELVQDVFLRVYRKCHLFDPGKGSFRAWLIQIASRRAFDRREYLNLHRFYDDRNLDDFVDVIQSACDVEYQTAIAQGEATLRKAFEQLNEKQRTTLELYFFEGYTLREISERLNESLGNARHDYYRALERLRTSIEKGSPRGDV